MFKHFSHAGYEEDSFKSWPMPDRGRFVQEPIMKNSSISACPAPAASASRSLPAATTYPQSRSPHPGPRSPPHPNSPWSHPGPRWPPHARHRERPRLRPRRRACSRGPLPPHEETAADGLFSGAPIFWNFSRRLPPQVVRSAIASKSADLKPQKFACSAIILECAKRFTERDWN